MSKILVGLTFVAFAMAPIFTSTMFKSTGVTPSTTIAAQEDCKEGEKWNEETQKCDAAEG